ncbi:MAG: ribosome small subunit-dependent GTPase A [Bryobacteraceae bacterium]
MDLREIGWESYALERTPDSSYGRVALAARERFLVWTAWGEVEATMSGRYRHLNTDQPCAGDWVVLRDGAVIAEVLPRRTKLSRKEPGKAAREQVLAANIDVLFVVSGLDGDYNPSRLERYLVLAYESGARPVILLNKSDLRADLRGVINRTERFAPGVPVLAVSALTQSGVDAIPSLIRQGETVAFIGSSGVGKSTIVNCLLGEDRQRTTPVRSADSKGRHTTTTRELILTPGQWLMMDLPGLRELQLWADPEQIDNAFSEIAALAAHCKFRDCTHQHEPGCAVREAGLEERRMESYQKLKRELAFLERQADPNLARETKKKWKAIEREIRHHPKRNG